MARPRSASPDAWPESVSMKDPLPVDGLSRLQTRKQGDEIQKHHR